MEEIEWTAENQVYMYQSMIGHKPVGINKHFEMLCIQTKFQEKYGQEVSSKALWKFLESGYNLKLLDEREAIPFPNHRVEFDLPDAEYGHLKALKLEEERLKSEKLSTASNIKDGVMVEANATNTSQESGNNDSESPSTSSKKNNGAFKKEFGKAGITKDEIPVKHTSKSKKSRSREGVKPSTIGLKADDSGSDGKLSPITVKANAAKKQEK